MGVILNSALVIPIPARLICRRTFATCVPVDYAGRALDYDAVRADDATDRGFWLRGLAEVGRIQPGENVLDLGAGTGRFASLLHGSNPVLALDSSREMLAIARSKAPFACGRAHGHQLPLR